MRLGGKLDRAQYALLAEGAGPVGTLSVTGQIALQARGVYSPICRTARSRMISSEPPPIAITLTSR